MMIKKQDSQLISKLLSITVVAMLLSVWSISAWAETAAGENQQTGPKQTESSDNSVFEGEVTVHRYRHAHGPFGQPRHLEFG
jgi:hypothetical protein